MLIFYLKLLDNETERSAFEQIYTQYKNRMFAIANHVLRDQHLAEDAVHDAFLYMAHHIDQYEGINQPMLEQRIVTLTKSRALDLYRRRKTRATEPIETEADAADPEPDALGQLLNRQGYRTLIDSISGLREDYRVVLQLRAIDGYDDDAICQMLKISRGNLHTRYHRAKEALLKRMLEEAAHDY